MRAAILAVAVAVAFAAAAAAAAAATATAAGAATVAIQSTVAAADSGARAAAPAAPSAPSADVRVLPWRRLVQAPPLRRGEWIEVWDDSLLAAGTAAEFADVRFIDDRGVAQTFARREPMLANVWYQPIPQRMHGDRDGTVLTADLGRDAPRGLALRVHSSTGGGQFVVEASADSLHWRAIGTAGVGPQPPGAFDTIDLGIVAERWIRVPIPHRRPAGASVRPRPDAEPAPEAASGTETLELLARSERRTPREPVRFRIVGERFESRTWIAELEIDGPAMALCRLKLVPRTTVAQHAVRVEGKLPGGGWRDLVHAAVESVPLPDGTARVGAIEWDPYRTRVLRVFVDGADAPNAPVRVDSLARTPLRFALPAPASTTWIAYGDAHVLAAHAPLDLDRGDDTRFARAQLGAPEANPFHRPPGFGLAWLQRHPQALAVLLVMILGAVAAIVLRRPSRL